MMDYEQLKAELQKVARESFWWGFIGGLVLGLIVGGLSGYNLGSDTVHIITLDQGIKT